MSFNYMPQYPQQEIQRQKELMFYLFGIETCHCPNINLEREFLYIQDVLDRANYRMPLKGFKYEAALRQDRSEEVPDFVTEWIERDESPKKPKLSKLQRICQRIRRIFS